MASISSIFIFKDGLMGCMPRQEGLLLSIEFDSSRTLTSACSGSVWPCRWLGFAGPFGPESEHVGVHSVKCA